jgi:hypothetical protein
MTRSIALAALLAASVGACAQKPAEPPPVAAVNPVAHAFDPYCGPTWSVGRQGYVQIPCPDGGTYDTLW